MTWMKRSPWRRVSREPVPDRSRFVRSWSEMCERIARKGSAPHLQEGRRCTVSRMDFERLHREESGRILSTLIGLLGDFDLAEEMLQEAYAAALQKWPAEGVPRNPRAWLISTARNRAIDRLRRDRLFDTKREEIARYAELTTPVVADSAASAYSAASADSTEEMFPDDRLRLTFTCCHPALATEAQVALTLHTVCG